MTRFITLVAAMAAAAQATMMSSDMKSGDMMSGDMVSGDMMSGDKGKSSDCMGSSCGGQMQDSGNSCMGSSCGQQSSSNNMGGISITVISTNQGGGAQWQQVGSAMDSSMMAEGAGQIHMVDVGGSAGLVYSPDTINAKVGDYVQFNFKSKNHTVTQSTFDSPCKKMMNGSMMGMDSGFMPNPDDKVSPPPAMKMQVMVDTPLWFYCKQKTPASHCQKGMVFSINPTAEKSQMKYKENAMKSSSDMGSMGCSGSSCGGGMESGCSGSSCGGMMTESSSTTSAYMSMQTMPSSSEGSPYVASGGSGSCQCSCLCGASAFPAGAGMGMYGGMPGSLPMSMMD